MPPQEIIISKNEAGQRFDKFLGKYFKEAGSGFIYKMLRKKNIELNGKKATGNEKLNLGDSIRIFMADDTIAKFRGVTLNNPATSDKATASKDIAQQNSLVQKDYDTIKNIIVYEDEHVLLVNKPAGILSQKATPSDISINEMLINYLLYKKELSENDLLTFKPSVCNRLDRNTTGLITFGKTLAGIQELSKGFKDRTFDKYYLAVVWGKITDKKVIDGYLVKDEAKNKVSIYKSTDANTGEGSYIKTQYEPLKHGIISVDGRERDITLLKIKLITGKTHQIRAHLSSIGHGLLGDDKYGRHNDNIYIKKHYGIKYQLLHSWELHFNDETMSETALKSLNGKVMTAEPDKLYSGLFDNRKTAYK